MMNNSSTYTEAQRVENIFGHVRSNKIFEMFVVGIIIFSALVIGVKTFDIHPGLARAVVFLDWFITIFFVVEISIRFMGETNKRHFFKSGWNIFDTIIVLFSIIPIEDSEMAIIGRLVRIFRVLRMVSIIPELRLLINSLLKALPQLGYVALLMFIIFYIYAAVGSTFFADIDRDLWGDIAASMLTLFRIMTFEDWTDIMYETQEVYPFSWIFYISFIFLTAFAFLNMIIGIVVSVIEKENKLAELESQQDEQHSLQAIRAELVEIKAILQQSNKHS
jgi:voltage-gated sodium channel